jgi:hypothetical protein
MSDDPGYFAFVLGITFELVFSTQGIYVQPWWIVFLCELFLLKPRTSEKIRFFIFSAYQIFEDKIVRAWIEYVNAKSKMHYRFTHMSWVKSPLPFLWKPRTIMKNTKYIFQKAIKQWTGEIFIFWLEIDYCEMSNGSRLLRCPGTRA